MILCAIHLPDCNTPATFLYKILRPLGSSEHILLVLLPACKHFAEWTFLRVGNRATSNKFLVAGHNLHHKWSKATATCHGHTISPRAAVCMPSFLWYALLPCPYLSNVSFQLSSVQGIALEQIGMGVLARTASESRVKKSRKHQIVTFDATPAKWNIDFYMFLFYHIHPYYIICAGMLLWAGSKFNSSYTTNAVGSKGCSIHLQAAKGFHLQGVAHQRVVPAIVVPGTKGSPPDRPLLC